MSRSLSKMKDVNDRSSERGGAGVKMLAVVLVIVVVANAGYNYVPVAYEGENFKQEMQTAVINGVAMPGNKIQPVDNVKARIQKAVADNQLPADTLLDVRQVGNVVQAHVVYSRQVGLLPFGIYNYTYHFDHIATPTGFLLKEN